MARSRNALAALFVMLPACNAILGMERAHLDLGEADAGTSMGAGGKPVTHTGTGGSVASGEKQLPDCTQNSDECMRCLDEKCGMGTSTDCLADPDCRNAVESHTTCISNHLCSDMTCASSIDTNQSLGNCYASCADKCTDRGLMPICNVYCACMQSECPDQFSRSLGNAMQSCIDSCNTDSSIHDNALCREVHCELAHKFGADPHCSHAVGLGQCTGPIPICLTGINTGLGPCTVDPDCCSGKCQHNICVTAQ